MPRVIVCDVTETLLDVGALEPHFKTGVRRPGEAIDEPLKGERLTRVAVYPAFWFGWYGFFPESTIWRPTR